MKAAISQARMDTARKSQGMRYKRATRTSDNSSSKKLNKYKKTFSSFLDIQMTPPASHAYSFNLLVTSCAARNVVETKKIR
jgi:hypothetical protein